MPRAFTIGTATKPYTTCYNTVYKGYNLSLDTDVDGKFPSYLNPSQHDLERSQGESWEFLLRPRSPGNIVFTNRGKSMAIAVGYVRMQHDCPLQHTNNRRDSIV